MMTTRPDGHSSRGPCPSRRRALPGAGTPDDPRLFLIGIRAHSAHFMTLDKPQPVVLFEIVKGRLTGQFPDVGEVHEVSGSGDSRPVLSRAGALTAGMAPPWAQAIPATNRSPGAS
jgi:hypothetical protein